MSMVRNIRTRMGWCPRTMGRAVRLIEFDQTSGQKLYFGILMTGATTDIIFQRKSIKLSLIQKICQTVITRKF